jgi:hypothetical protein
MSRYDTRPPTDSHGTLVEPGDLVISYGEIGIVSKINSYNAPTIRIPREINIYAWEWGAPDLDEEYQEWGRYDDNGVWRYGYHGEKKTRKIKDKRIVGTQPGFATTNRQTTYSLTVVRKHDGSLPGNFEKIVEQHKTLFPMKETSGSDE